MKRETSFFGRLMELIGYYVGLLGILLDLGVRTHSLDEQDRYSKKLILN